MKIAGYQIPRRGVQTAQGLILLYHRIAEVDTDPWGLCVSRRNFTEHLSVIRELGFPLGLGELIRCLSTNTLPRRAIVVTFDDGYADNLYSAKPLLVQQSIPATVFVITGMIGKNRVFWWDELHRVLLEPATVPALLSLTIKETTFQWNSEEPEPSHIEAQRNHLDSPFNKVEEARKRLFHSVYHLLLSLTSAERQDVLDELVKWSGSQPENHPLCRAMSHQEVCELAEGGIIDVGAHTVSHPALSQHATDRQQAEIRKSREELQDLLGRPIMSFAYPFGRSQDYTAETAALVKKAGFSCACSTRGDLLSRDEDLFDLPRFTVPDWSGEKFGQWLNARLSG